MNRKLFVGNLSFNTEERTLQDLFAQAGPVASVRVMRSSPSIFVPAGRAAPSYRGTGANPVSLKYAST